MILASCTSAAADETEPRNATSGVARFEEENCWTGLFESCWNEGAGSTLLTPAPVPITATSPRYAPDAFRLSWVSPAERTLIDGE